MDALAPTTKPRRKHRCISQDTKGRWQLDYRTPEGKRRRKLCGSFDDARAKLAEIDATKRKGTFIDESSSPTFESYAQYYLENVSSHKNSHECEKRFMKNLLAHFGGFRLSRIKRTHVIEYRTVRLQTVGGTTVNREVALLRHLFNVAIAEGKLGVNPARGGAGLEAFEEQRRERFLEKAEIDRLLAAIQARIARTVGASAKKAWLYLHTIVVVALHTGMRKGEILGLRWEQINWDRRHILLTKTKNNEPRRVPIDSILLHELAEHRVRVEHSELVFPSYDRDGNVVPLGDVKLSFGRVLRDAAITNFRFHDLRHTFASHYMMGGGQLYTLAKILGHKTIAMTQRYADLSPDFIDRERERMDTIWTPASKSGEELARANQPKYLQ